jgi:hypothetical protein
LRYTHRRMIGLGAWICRERFSDLAAHGWRGAPTVPKRSARQWFQSGRPNSQPQILLNLGTPCADINQPGDFRGPVTDKRRRAIILRLGGVVLFLAVLTWNAECPNLDSTRKYWASRGSSGNFRRSSIHPAQNAGLQDQIRRSFCEHQAMFGEIDVAPIRRNPDRQYQLRLLQATYGTRAIRGSAQWRRFNASRTDHSASRQTLAS